MYRSILFVFILILSPNLFGQRKVNTELCFRYFKTWNYLKYYHPDLASGKVDADSLFLKHLPEILKTTDEKTFNRLIGGVLSNLSTPVKRVESQKEVNDLLDQNLDFKWYENGTAFDKKNKQSLRLIFRNRYIGDDHYYITEKSFNELLPHEKEYNFPSDTLIPVEYRMLALAKILGIVDYLYPHKYLMEQSFDELTKNQIFPILESDTREDYERMLLVLAASLQDSHAFSFYKQMKRKKEIFKNIFYPPFDYQVFDDGILITEIIVPELCSGHDLKVGDYITSINGQTVPSKIEELSFLLSSSNRQTLIYHLSNYVENLVWGLEKKEVNLEVLRGNTKQPKTIPFIGSGDPNLKLLNEYLGSLKSNEVENDSLVVLNQDIAYFYIHDTFRFIENVEDEKIYQQMDFILNLAKSKKGIIFDMREYPDWGGFVTTFVMKNFAETITPYAKYYEVNKKEVGTYVLKTTMDAYYTPELKLNGSPAYTGKVVIIVNPATRSMSEWNTMNLQLIFPNSVTIGEQSSGADGDMKTLNLPGGYEFYFTGNAIFYPDGTEAQKKGVKIDIPIKLTRENYLKNEDLMLQKAIEFIQSR
jgi:C-terminal processing protease CtpA/Prc